jgi:1,4-dihydroxy-2-naphthoate octaprenyltransferase
MMQRRGLRSTESRRTATRRALPGLLVGHPYVRHLRLHFNLLLSPIFLWGALLGGADIGDPRLWLGWLSLHVFLYGGTTALNSFYDRDEGPVGGMFTPPAVDSGLLRFSLLFQALGLLPALLLGVRFTLAWLLLFLVFTAYSHPRVRFKADPVQALAAIAFGQGALGFTLGWLAAAAPARGLSLFSTAALTGLLGMMRVVSGLYIVTQSYQTLEDRARGDRTLPVLLGSRNALLVALLLLGSGGMLLLTQLAAGLGALIWIPALLFALLGAWLLRWALTFDEQRVRTNYLTAMRLTGTASLGLLLVLLLQFLLCLELPCLL